MERASKRPGDGARFMVSIRNKPFKETQSLQVAAAAGKTSAPSQDLLGMIRTALPQDRGTNQIAAQCLFNLPLLEIEVSAF